MGETFGSPPRKPLSFTSIDDSIEENQEDVLSDSTPQESAIEILGNAVLPALGKKREEEGSNMGHDTNTVVGDRGCRNAIACAMVGEPIGLVYCTLIRATADWTCR